MSKPYSDLQVVVAEEEPKYSLGGPQKAWTIPEQLSSDKIAVQATTHDFPTPVYGDAEGAQSKSRRTDRICGLSKQVFWILIGVAIVVVIGAAVGGGVGASLSNKSNFKSLPVAGSSSSTSTSTTTIAIAPANSVTLVSSQSESSTQSATPTTQSSSRTVSTTTIVGPSGTLLSDCPSSNNTVYTPDSSTEQFRKLCGVSLLNVNNDAAAVTVQVTTLDDCISACAGFNLQYASDIAAGKTSVCNAACWRSTGGDYGGWCYGYTTQNTSGTFHYGDDTRCNSAALINQ